ncbi:Peptidase T [Tritrichomonas foetus]|uniref:Peptidase T n=1 Tax=Tritrichomonas foetus TaxID=1144522 RepID=A0A1J4KJT1_9EUKA|nr:Peptidase T [Tritrichomonas foetus]|eukprot:OHT10092.1 Peptidase T [Tritrichomonas foetus]
MASREEVLKSRFAIDYIKQPLLDRFIRYVKVHTTSSEEAPEDQKPSTKIQFDLANILVEELKALGIEDVTIDEHACVIAKVPGSPGLENLEPILFNSHMDTSCACSGENVNPQIHENYDGGKIELKDGIILDPKIHTNLMTAIGDTVITSDGTTLLGADDKSGISEIMTMLDVILNHEKIPHCPLEIMFSCDEEIGRGTQYFPKEKIKSKVGFTVDGDVEGSIEYENFNAYTVIVNFKGVSAHTGYARGKLANAVTMASTFVSMLPRTESPEATDGRYGFYCPISIKGELESAQVVLILRDFQMSGIERRIEACRSFARAVEAMYPGSSVEVVSKLGYLNMYDKLQHHPEVIQNLSLALQNAGIEPKPVPIRGGTDGSTLTSKYDIMTPNIFTGSDNFHSRYEWSALGQMIGSVRVLIELVKIYSAHK